jgi:hypothetical protein
MVLRARNVESLNSLIAMIRWNGFLAEFEPLFHHGHGNNQFLIGIVETESSEPYTLEERFFNETLELAAPHVAFQLLQISPTRTFFVVESKESTAGRKACGVISRLVPSQKQETCIDEPSSGGSGDGSALLGGNGREDRLQKIQELLPIRTKRSREFLDLREEVLGSAV